MLRRLFLSLAFGAAAFCFSASAHAQIANGNQWPKPRLTNLSPCGGKAGTSVETTFVGAEVDTPQSLWFSHPGIKGTPVIPPPPMPDPKVKDPPKKDPPPITKFNVTIAADVPPGFYDVRIVSKNGVSNPRVFHVATLNEVAEKEPNNDIEQAQKIDVGSIINGSIAAPTDVDYYLLAGKKGQRVTIVCLAESLDSKLNPEMKLVGPGNRQIGYSRALSRGDGVIDTVLPEDGEYLVRLNHFTYTAGSADHFYRLIVGPTPWIEAVFPPAIEAGKPAQITVYGRNLPGGTPDPKAMMDGLPLEKAVISVTAPADAAKLEVLGSIAPTQAVSDGFQYRITGPGGVSNPYFIGLTTGPVTLENDDNDTAEKAQKVTVPCEIAGRVDKPRDRDWFAFDAKKGDTFNIEVLSHRLGAPTDMYFLIKSADGKSDITLQDDVADTLSIKAFYNAHRDPGSFKFVAPLDGTYKLLVASHLDTTPDVSHVYTVRIGQEKPDFRLFVMPGEDYRHDSLVMNQNSNEYVTVYVERKDGFKGEVTVTVEGLPAGVTCPPQTIGKTQKLVHLVLSAADGAADFTGAVKVMGTATVGATKLVREARPATISWPTQPQQNQPAITRLDRAFLLAVRAEKAPGKLTAAPDKFVVSLGDKLKIPLKLTRTNPEFKGNFQIAPVAGELPQGLTFGNLTFAPGKDDQTADLAVAATVPPGKYGITFRGFAPIPAPTIAPAKEKTKAANTILAANAIEVTVLPKEVAKLTVDNGNPTLKLGGEVVVTLKAARQFDYDEAIKVALLPENANGVTAAEVVIPPGQTDAKVTFKVPAAGAVGQRSNLTIRAVAVVNGIVTLNHDLKINVNVVK